MKYIFGLIEWTFIWATVGIMLLSIGVLYCLDKAIDLFRIKY